MLISLGSTLAPCFPGSGLLLLAADFVLLFSKSVRDAQNPRSMSLGSKLRSCFLGSGLMLLVVEDDALLLSFADFVPLSSEESTRETQNPPPSKITVGCCCPDRLTRLALRLFVCLLLLLLLFKDDDVAAQEISSK
jgi:hypothetical protein